MEKMREIYGPEPPQPVRTYKDRLFRMIFKDKAEFLTLYNALNGTSYDNPEALKITTLEHAVYIGMKNDLSFLLEIPNLTVMSPKNRWEMADMVRFAVDFPYPVALRYPRGEAYEGLKEFRTPILYGKSEVISRESGIAILFIGHMSGLGESVWKAIKEAGYHCSLINARFAKPLDTELIRDLCRDHELIVTIEENVLAGGFGEQVVQYVMQTGEKTRVRTIGISDDYVEHGNVEVCEKKWDWIRRPLWHR